MHTTSLFNFVGTLPTDPAIYTLYGGTGRGRHVAYVGLSGSLRRRMRQHFIRRDSSIVTGASAASLNPDLVTRVEWWTHPRFDDTTARKAAERVALELFEPALRSRARITSQVDDLSDDAEFRREMEALFRSTPAGHVEIQTLSDALDQIRELEERIDSLEAKLQSVLNRHVEE